LMVIQNACPRFSSFTLLLSVIILARSVGQSGRDRPDMVICGRH
jgi:hypothetical protein